MRLYRQLCQGNVAQQKVSAGTKTKEDLECAIKMKIKLKKSCARCHIPEALLKISPGGFLHYT